jgi:hypothetical protein
VTAFYIQNIFVKKSWYAYLPRLQTKSEQHTASTFAWLCWQARVGALTQSF